MQQDDTANAAQGEMQADDPAGIYVTYSNVSSEFVVHLITWNFYHIPVHVGIVQQQNAANAAQGEIQAEDPAGMLLIWIFLLILHGFI